MSVEEKISKLEGEIIKLKYEFKVLKSKLVEKERHDPISEDTGFGVDNPGIKFHRPILLVFSHKLNRVLRILECIGISKSRTKLNYICFINAIPDGKENLESL